MNHLLMLPILVPLTAGCLLLLAGRYSTVIGRWLGLSACVVQLVLAALLLREALGGAIHVYALGNWPPPFGIVLVLDRLAALMLLATAGLALPALLYASAGEDRRGLHFHALFQFQLLGLNGAFLTGDLFNLFVFFEVLLIASYALLMHGQGRERSAAALHYVVLNLVGSALFLIALGLLYGLAGTLNMADLAVFMAVAEEDAPLLAAAGLLLLVVFALKAALLPLHLWLPRAYAAASAPVAALFAVMTKVGVYAILRVYTLVFGADAGHLANLAADWLWPLGLLTIAAGTIGALAASNLGALLGYLVLVSVGTLLAGLSLGTAAALAATLYYLVHSTWVSGALFLLAGSIARQRGVTGGELRAGPTLRQPQLLGGLFFIGAIAVIGLPPLSGFIGKVALLQAAPPGSILLLWTALLGAGLVTLVAFSRAGSTLFWRAAGKRADRSTRAPIREWLAVAMLLAASALLSAGGEPLLRYTGATAAQLLNTRAMVDAVLMSGAPAEETL